MDQFACGYCGTEQIVRRQGGTVSLKMVTEAISRVQTGTDRTAAELAIRRLTEELAALDTREQQIAMERSKLIGPGTLFSMAVLFFIIFAVAQSAQWDSAPAFIVVGVVLFFIALIKCFQTDRFQKPLSDIIWQRAVLTQRLAEQRAIVDT